MEGRLARDAPGSPARDDALKACGSVLPAWDAVAMLPISRKIGRGLAFLHWTVPS